MCAHGAPFGRICRYPGMRSLTALAIVVLALGAGCVTKYGEDGSDDGDDGDASSGITLSASANDDAPAVRDDDASDDADADNDADAPPANDGPSDDGNNDDDTPPPASPPPTSQDQSCQVWQDCGPHFGDMNSGFDCDDSVCACDADGAYDAECARIGGVWSAEECFCFVTNSRPPAPANDPDRDDDEPYCWWRWHEECEPDEWVDTSYYRRECDSQGCRDRYVHRGYWRDGDCDDVWTRLCDDGTRQVYR